MQNESIYLFIAMYLSHQLTGFIFIYNKNNTLIFFSHSTESIDFFCWIGLNFSK